MGKDQVVIEQDVEARAVQDQDAPGDELEMPPESAQPEVSQEQQSAEAVEEQVSEPAADTSSQTPTEQVSEPEANGSGTDEEEPEADTDKPSLADLKVGSTVRGKVRNLVDFGAFIDIGVGRDGLAHISSLKRAGIDKTIQVGDEIDVVVRRVDTSRNRISLTVPRAERAVKASLEQIEVGSVVEGRIKRLVDFGAFVDIGAPTDGLLHVSQLPWGYVRHPSEVLNVGDTVEVRILDVDTERRRISLSMKGQEQQDKPKPQQKQSAPVQERDSDAPTAFELAFQQALKAKRQRGQSRD